jgi:hypothetical protein
MKNRRILTSGKRRNRFLATSVKVCLFLLALLQIGFIFQRQPALMKEINFNGLMKQFILDETDYGDVGQKFWGIPLGHVELGDGVKLARDFVIPGSRVGGVLIHGFSRSRMVSRAIT